MDWLSENWFWVVIGLAFIAMHMFGHGGHGGHGRRGRRNRAGREDRSGPVDRPDDNAPPAHRH